MWFMKLEKEWSKMWYDTENAAGLPIIRIMDMPELRQRLRE